MARFAARRAGAAAASLARNGFSGRTYGHKPADAVVSFGGEDIGLPKTVNRAACIAKAKAEEIRLQLEGYPTAVCSCEEKKVKIGLSGKLLKRTYYVRCNPGPKYDGSNDEYDNASNCKCPQPTKGRFQCDGSMKQCAEFGYINCNKVECKDKAGDTCHMFFECDKDGGPFLPGQTTDPSGSGDGSGDDTGGAGTPIR